MEHRRVENDECTLHEIPPENPFPFPVFAEISLIKWEEKLK